MAAMASHAKKFSVLLFALLSSLHVHARESQFFSKATNVNNNNGGMETSQSTLKQQDQDPLFNKEFQEPNFIPQTQDRAYGLFGHESGQLPPSTTTTTTNEVQDRLNNNNNYKAEPLGMSDTRFMERGEYYNGANMYNANQQAMEETRFMENFNSQNQRAGKSQFTQNEKYNNENGMYNNENGMYNNEKLNSQNQVAGEPQFTENEKYNNENGMYNKEKLGMGENYNKEKLGMSDTRFLENGKYYYDLNSENNYNQRFSRGADSMNQYNSRGQYENNGNFNGFNSNNKNSVSEYQNQNQNQNQEMEYPEDAGLP